MKHFKGSHKDLMKGEDMRDSKALIEKKGKKMFDKIKNNKSGGFKTKDKEGNRVYSPKTMAKINKGHTRSKMIVRESRVAGGAKGSGGSRGGTRGGRGGSGGRGGKGGSRGGRGGRR
jgi:hypothetical protein